MGLLILLPRPKCRSIRGETVMDAFDYLNWLASDLQCLKIEGVSQQNIIFHIQKETRRRKRKA